MRIGPDASYWTAVLPLALLFGLGLASLLPPLTASAMNSAPDSLAGLASGVNNAVARVAGLLWIAALPPITGLTGAAYTDPVQFQVSFAEISWICAAAFACAAALAAILITGPGRASPGTTARAHPDSGPPPRLPGRHRSERVVLVGPRRLAAPAVERPQVTLHRGKVDTMPARLPDGVWSVSYSTTERARA